MSNDLRVVAARAGSSDVPYVDPAFPDRPLVLRIARPRNYDADTPVLFVHHGARRNGYDYRDFWLPLVDEADVLVIAPEFSEEHFPKVFWYNFGNLRDESGKLRPREPTASSAGCSRRCAATVSRGAPVTACSAIRPAVSSCIECCRWASASGS